MARPLRIEYPHAFYHVIQRGIERKDIFLLDQDRYRFLGYLARAHEAYEAVIHAYCLMSNHYHLIIETPQANLAKVMHYLNASYAAYFNTKRQRVGPLYQGRYKAVIVDENNYLDTLSRYIHLNPVRAGITQDPLVYSWSSYRYFVTDQAHPDWLCTETTLSIFSGDCAHARRLYRTFALAGVGKACDKINENAQAGIALGGEAFLAFIREQASDHAENSAELPQARAVLDSLSLDKIQDTVNDADITDKRLRRGLMIYQMRRHTPHTLKEIAAFCGNIGYTGISQVYRRIEARRRGDKMLDFLIQRLDLQCKSAM